MGIEPTANSTEKTSPPPDGGAISGAPAKPTSSVDPSLASLIDAWPTLPEPIRAGILARVWAAGQ